MKTLTNLSILALTIMATSCNEKVSPELLKSNTTTGTPQTPDISPITSYHFSVKDASPALLNFKLHQTGYGNANKDCKITSTAKFSTELFQDDQTQNDKSYDITCFFEAEELSLFYNGFSFDVESSPNSCDYVGYQPFGFFDRIPGDSSGTYTKVVCTNDTTNGTHVPPVEGKTLECGQYISENRIQENGIEAFIVEDDEDLCRFNYKDENSEIKCDIGKITINELQVTYTPPENGAPPQPAKIVREKRALNCGGKISNCVKGPVKTVKDSVNAIEVSSVKTNTIHKKNYIYPELFSKAYSVKSYANYRRHLANRDLNFGDSADIKKTADYFIDSFLPYDGPNSIQYTFDPSVIDRYSRNLKEDGITPIITPPEAVAYGKRNNNRYSVVPYAAEPFLGINGYYINPFYTFYCFDKAFDVKARIRMVVREWDRIFPITNADLELLSDIWREGSARQDTYDNFEGTTETSSVFKYNDVEDWDDKIPMLRTTDPAWKPSGTTENGLHTGWFKDIYFTNGDD